MNADIDLSWLHTFDKDELIELINELISAMEEPIESCYNTQEEIIYEWEQSAAAINDTGIQAAFEDKDN